jgi:hypothetical protein
MWRVSRPDAVSALEDASVRRSLPRYVDVVKNYKRAKFHLNVVMEADFSPEDATGRLWALHRDLLKTYNHVERERLTRDNTPSSYSARDRSWISR